MSQPSSLVTLGRLINNNSRPKKKFSLETEFGSETTGCRFNIVSNWLVNLIRGLISLVNDNQWTTTLRKFCSMYTLGKQSTQKFSSGHVATHALCRFVVDKRMRILVVKTFIDT